MSIKSRDFCDPPSQYFRDARASSENLFSSTAKCIRREVSSGISSQNFLPQMATEKEEFSRLASDFNELEQAKKRSNVRRQYFAALTMDLLGFSYGASCGWTSASVPLLMSEDTPLDSGPMTMHEASWIASSICMGGFVGNLFVGWVRMKSCHRSERILKRENVKAFDANRTEVFAAPLRSASDRRLAADLLRSLAILPDNVTCDEWPWWRRPLLDRSDLHFRDCRRQRAWNARLDSGVFLQFRTLLRLCLR